MNPPKWYMPVAIIALIWNLLGCMAYLADVMITPDMLAQLTPAQQEMYAARTWWGVAGTAVAVWFGAAGSLGLVLRMKWARILLLLSLVGVIVQDIGIFVVAKGVEAAGTTGLVLQAIVLIVAYALLRLAGLAVARAWIPKTAS